MVRTNVMNIILGIMKSKNKIIFSKGSKIITIF